MPRDITILPEDIAVLVKQAPLLAERLRAVALERMLDTAEKALHVPTAELEK